MKRSTPITGSPLSGPARAERDALTEALSIATGERDQLKAELTAALSQRDAALEAAAHLAEKSHAKLEALNAELERLRARKPNDLQADLSSALAERDDARAQLKHAQADGEHNAKLAVNAAQQVLALQSQLAVACNERDAANARLAVAGDQLDGALRTGQRLNADNERLARLATELKAKLDAPAALDTKLRAELAVARERLAERIEQCEALQRNALLEACKAALLRLDHHDEQSAPEALQLRAAIALAHPSKAQLTPPLCG